MSLKVKVVSDVICPFCYLGKRNFEKALQNMDKSVNIELEWLPFQLNPTIRNSVLKKDIYIQKFGDRFEAIKQRTTDMFAQQDLSLTYEGYTGNTLQAHRLLWWVQQTHGVKKQNEVQEELFKNYFEEAKDISDIKILKAAAQICGIDASPIFEDQHLYTQEVQKCIRDNSRTISGVPHFFIGEYELSGAQPPEVIRQCLEQVIKA